MEIRKKIRNLTFSFLMVAGIGSLAAGCGPLFKSAAEEESNKNKDKIMQQLNDIEQQLDVMDQTLNAAEKIEKQGFNIERLADKDEKDGKYYTILSRNDSLFKASVPDSAAISNPLKTTFIGMKK